VARGINWASGHAEVAGRILHLCSGLEDAIKIPVLMQHVCAFRRARAPNCLTSTRSPRFASCSSAPYFPEGAARMADLTVISRLSWSTTNVQQCRDQTPPHSRRHHCAPSTYVSGDHAALLRPSESRQRWERGYSNRSLGAIQMPSATSGRRATPKGHPYMCPMCSLALVRRMGRIMCPFLSPRAVTVRIFYTVTQEI
jgi:hypothetical protein